MTHARIPILGVIAVLQSFVASSHGAPPEVPLTVAAQMLKSNSEAPSDAFTEPQLSLLVRSLAATTTDGRITGDLSKADVSALLEIYRLADKEPVYTAVLIAEMTKRVLLDWARAQIAALARSDEDGVAVELRSVRDVIGGLTLDPDRLMLLEREDGAVAEDPQRLDLAASVAKICKAHGYASINGWLLDTNRAAVPTLESALLQPDVPSVLYRLLESEMIRTVWINGTIEFLLRGGDVDLVSVHDVRPFREVIPYADARRFAFPLLGVKALRAPHVLWIVGEENEARPQPARWIRATFDAARQEQKKGRSVEGPE